MKLARVVLLALVGACAGAAAGVIIVALLGGLSFIPYIVTHTSPKNDPVTMFLAGVVMLGLVYGLGIGAPVGAVIGLVTGMILGIRSPAPGDATACKLAVPLDDDCSTAALPPGKDGSGTSSSSSVRSWGLVVVTVLVIPGMLALWRTAYGWLEMSAFDRFAAEARKSGGNATIESADWWSGTIDSVIVEFSGTATTDLDLERMTRLEMFRQVRALELAGTRVTDKGVALLDRHLNLQRLDLSRTEVTDRGLASLSTSRPNSLNLSGTRVTDAALEILREQAKLTPNRSINLTDTQVTEEKVRELGKSNSSMNIAYGSSESRKHTR